MLVPATPLSFDDVLGGAVRFIRTNPGLILGVSAVSAVVGQAFALLYQLLQPRPTSTPTEALNGLGAVLAVTAVGLPLILLVGSAVSALLYVLLDGEVRGAGVPVRAAWARARRRVPGTVGLSVLVGVGAGVLAVVLVLPVVVVVATVADLVTLLLIVPILALVAVVVLVFLAVRLALLVPVYVLEGVNVDAAFRRSWNLTRGVWWRTFGAVFVAYLPGGGLIGILTFVITPPDLAAIGSAPPFGASVLLAVLSAVVAVFSTPFLLGVTGLLHVDRRRRTGT